MIRLRRASALVTLFVLTLAATADAECAWVLWGWTPSDSARPDGLGSFSPIAGHEALSKCMPEALVARTAASPEYQRGGGDSRWP